MAGCGRIDEENLFVSRKCAQSGTVRQIVRKSSGRRRSGGGGEEGEGDKSASVYFRQLDDRLTRTRRFLVDGTNSRFRIVRRYK